MEYELWLAHTLPTQCPAPPHHTTNKWCTPSIDCMCKTHLWGQRNITPQVGTLCWAKQTIMSRALCTVNYSDPVMEIQTMVSLSMFLRERQSCSRRPSCSTTTSSNLSSSCSLAKHTHLTFQQQILQTKPFLVLIRFVYMHRIKPTEFQFSHSCSWKDVYKGNVYITVS